MVEQRNVGCGLVSLSLSAHVHVLFYKCSAMTRHSCRLQLLYFCLGNYWLEKKKEKGRRRRKKRVGGGGVETYVYLFRCKFVKISGGSWAGSAKTLMRHLLAPHFPLFLELLFWAQGNVKTAWHWKWSCVEGSVKTAWHWKWSCVEHRAAWKQCGTESGAVFGKVCTACASRNRFEIAAWQLCMGWPEWRFSF